MNRKSILVCKCAGDTHGANLQVLYAMLDLPQLISKNVYTEHVRATCKEATSHAQSSMARARAEVREHYGATSDDDVVDILVSCDGTWQRRGHISLFGAVFIIAYETGKVLDYTVKSKHCAACKYWEKKDKISEEYQRWKEAHKYDINFEGSAGAMEPHGTVEMFQASLQHKIRYTQQMVIQKMHNMLLEQ